MNAIRRKTMVSFAIDPDLLKELEDWLACQEFPPTKTAVIEASIRRFLADKAGISSPNKR
jgi:hypothetical protein